MEFMRHETPALTMRYSHLSVNCQKRPIDELPASNAEMDLQQVSQQTDEEKVAEFRK
jgi:hypothetical protein